METKLCIWCGSETCIGCNGKVDRLFEPYTYNPTHEPAAIQSESFADVQNHAAEERKEATTEPLDSGVTQLAPDFTLSNSESDDVVINAILVEYCATPATSPASSVLSIDNIRFRPREGITGADIFLRRKEVVCGIESRVSDVATTHDGVIRQVIVTIQGVTFSCDTEWLLMLRDPVFRDAAIKQVKETNAAQEQAAKDDAVALAREQAAISGDESEEGYEQGYDE